ncbi:MAG: MOSC domain-containing protein [Sterolibacterium sp.]
MTIFIGDIRLLPSDSKPTGIFKSKLQMPAWLGCDGIAGDAQADRRVHGGPEKAVHQYPAAHYPRLAEVFPEAGSLLVPGSIGENLSMPGWDETNVCIGDTFRLGDAVIQISQPRTPCWKIDSRYGVEGMARFIEAEGLTGWYFRVIEAGIVGPGSEFSLIERLSAEATVSGLLALWRKQRPAPEELECFAETPALSPNWVNKLRDRGRQLRQRSPQQ